MVAADDGTWVTDGIGVAVYVNTLIEQGRSSVQGMLVGLPTWARGAVLAAGCVALMLGVAILAWLLRPGCLARLCCRRRRRDSEKVTPPTQSKHKHSIDEELQLENVTYRSWARGSLYDTPISGDGGETASQASHRDSTYSSMSDGTDTSSILSYASGACPGGEGAGASSATQADGEGVAVVVNAVGGPPSVLLQLQFLGQDGASSSTGRLAITVLEGRGLPARDYGCSPDPAVQLSIATHRRRWLPRLPRLGVARTGEDRPLHQLRTRTVRHARQPHFNEDFAVEARKADLKDWVLQVVVTDDCRVRGSTPLCVGELRLRGPALRQMVAGEPARLSVPLAPRPVERAMLLFGLSLLPTAQRLNVSIIKATRVRLDHVVPSLAHFRPYVRATLLHASSGRRLESARTDPQEPSAHPEFCETLSLKLNPAQMGALSLVVALCHRLPEGDERVPGSRRPRDRVVGAVAIGGRVSNERGREHWRAIEQRPRRVVSIWHTLT